MDTRSLPLPATEWHRTVRARREDDYAVVFRRDLISCADRALADAVRSDAPSLVVTTPSIECHYGAAIRTYFALNAADADITYTVLTATEATKSVEEVLALTQAAAAAKLGRRSQIITFGGGVALDISGLAATLFRRGIASIRVPTTLIGMMDAGIGVKTGVNFQGGKSLLGSFNACEACYIDPRFLDTLPRRHLACGLAECVKIAVIGSPELFDLLERTAPHLSSGGPLPASIDAIIRLAAEGTIDELELNLFERKALFPRAYTRKLDFGHTFSPHIEVASLHALLHGEAVAVDIAISTLLAACLGLLDALTAERILRLLEHLGLPLAWDGLNPDALHASLNGVVAHRDGMLNLVVPRSIGHASFIEDVSRVGPDLLTAVVKTLKARAAAQREEGDGRLDR